MDTAEVRPPWSRWLRSTKDQLESRAGFTAPQVEHGNEAGLPGGGWLGWDAWVSTPLADGVDER